MRTSAAPAVRSGFVCLVVLLVAGSLAASAGPRPDWWPEGKQPPFVQAVPADSAAPRALLLRSARLLTDAPAAADGLAAALPAGLRGAPVASGGLLLVQFQPRVAAAERLEILARHGAVGGDYIPNNTLIARVPAASVEALAADPGVAWLGRLHPGLKLSPGLGKTDLMRETWKLRLVAAPGTTADELAADARAAGVTVLGAGGNTVDVEAFVDEPVVALARLDSVLSVEEVPLYTFYNRDVRWVCQSNIGYTDSIHNRGLKGAGQIVTLMDSGLDVNHCCFRTQAGKVVDNRAWGGGVLGTGCQNEHGTHTAGTAVCGGGQFNDGMAPDSTLIFQDVGKSGSPTICSQVFPPNPLSGAWDDARGRGSFIHSNSWGGGGGSNLYTSDSQAIDQYMWNQQNFLILFAAGNDGPGPSTLGYHSNAKNSVTVGATKNGASRETMADFSSRGYAGDGRTLPDLTGPGEPVSSSLNQPTASCGWVNLQGTSMSTPALAGSAALVREYYMKGYYPSGTASAADGFTPSAALLKATLLVSARNMSTVLTRPDPVQGFGRVTLDDALWFADEPTSPRLRILDDRNTATGFTATGQEHVYDVNVTAAGDVKFMLAWTDYPGATLAAKELVNDLDLSVQLAPPKQDWIYTGNIGWDNGWSSQTSPTFDTKNNKEAVYLRNLSPQHLTVKVRASAINNVVAHAQDYALVVVGPVEMPCNQPAPTGVGNTVTHAKSGTNLLAAWADRGAHHYNVYRGTSPTSIPIYNNNVVDGDAGTPGIQWTDVGGLSGTTSYFYLYTSANSCGQEAP